MSTDEPAAGTHAPPASAVAVIIVTYASEHVLAQCLERVSAQSHRPELIVIVDNGSPEPSYLDAVRCALPLRQIRLDRNEGFCTGNNVGYALARACPYVLFLNPDAFLSERFLEQALEYMQRPENAAVGCLTGTLLGFDLGKGRPTGLIDSTGIFQRWYGRWYDRGRGEPVPKLELARAEDVPAACGALMFCRSRALDEASLQPGEVFDSRFFMYKEDIDLSLRMRHQGWRVVYVPRFLCHHGRGWQGRHLVSYRARYLSVRNELRVSLRNRLRGLPYSLTKFLYVVAIEPIFRRPRRRFSRRLETARGDSE